MQLADSVRSQRFLEGLWERLRDGAVQKVYPVACGDKHYHLALGRPVKAQPDGACACTPRLSTLQQLAECVNFMLHIPELPASTTLTVQTTCEVRKKKMD